jgi:hypothetical protein
MASTAIKIRKRLMILSITNQSAQKQGAKGLVQDEGGVVFSS